MMERRLSKYWAMGFIRWAFAVALALLYVLVLRSVAVQIAPPPEPETEPYPDVSTQDACEAAGGRWVTGKGNGTAPVRAVPPGASGEVHEYCQGPLAFEREREVLYEDSQQTSLFVFALGGAAAVAAALLIAQLAAVAPGLMIGGIVSFFIAGVHIWQLAPSVGRLIVIIAIFVVLVGIGMYAFGERRGSGKPEGTPVL